MFITENNNKKIQMSKKKETLNNSLMQRKGRFHLKCFHTFTIKSHSFFLTTKKNPNTKKNQNLKSHWVKLLCS